MSNIVEHFLFSLHVISFIVEIYGTSNYICYIISL